MVDPTDHEALETARHKAGLSVKGLWIRYFELGGDASFIEMEAILNGALMPTTLQRNIIVHAINEALREKGVSERVDYRHND